LEKITQEMEQVTHCYCILLTVYKNNTDICVIANYQSYILLH
jgi:hypothetical protein